MSNIAAIKVTQDNVDQLYNNMLTPDTQFSTFQGAHAQHETQSPTFQGTQDQHQTQFSPFQHQQQTPDLLDFDSILSNVHSLPRDLFVSQVLKDSRSDRDRLEAVKSDLFVNIQEF